MIIEDHAPGREWRRVLKGCRKQGYRGADSYTELWDWVERHYNGAEINGRQLTIDKLKDMYVEAKLGCAPDGGSMRRTGIADHEKIHDVSDAGYSATLDVEKEAKRRGWRRVKSYTKTDPDQLDRGDFDNFTHFLRAIADTATGRYDKRLEPYDAKARHDSTITKTQEAFTGVTGGFTIPQGFRAQVLQSADEAAPWLMNRQRFEAQHSSVTVPILDDADRSSDEVAGFKLVRTGEGSTLADDPILFRGRTYTMRKAGRLVRINSELLEDTAVAFEETVRTVFGRAIALLQSDDFLNGSAATEPLGVLQSSAFYSQAKVSNQAASTITSRNILEMLSRLEPGAIRSSIWLGHSSIVPQVANLPLIGKNDSGGTASSFGGGNLFAMGGASDSALGMLVGRRLYLTDALPSLGNANDIVLIDPSAAVYVMSMDSPRVDLDRSRYFDSDQIALRVVIRDDGGPSRNQTLTDRQSRTLASFIGLAARS